MPAPFVPPPDDSSVQMLRAVFGTIIDRLSGSVSAITQTPEATMLAAAFEYYNSGILFFGSVLLAWITITGTAHTANDGEALGKNWSTMWTPIRTLAATGSLMPLSSGYSIIQAFVLTVVLWSIGLASGLWNKVIDVTVNKNLVEHATQTVINESSVQDATVAALQMQVCAKSIMKAVNAALVADGGQAINLVLRKSELDEAGKHSITMVYADESWPGSGGFCGSLTIDTANAVQTTGGLTSLDKHLYFFDNSNAAAQVQAEIAPQVQGIANSYFTGLLNGGGAIGELSDKIVNTTDQVSAQNFVVAVQDGSAMWAQIRDAATAAARDSNKNVTAALSTGGWIYAGSWQTELGRVKDAINATVGNVKVIYTPARNDLSQSLSGDLLAATQPILNQSMTTAREVTTQAMEHIRKSQSSSAVQKSGFCSMPLPPVTENSISLKEVITDGGGKVKERVSSYFNYSLGDTIIGCIIGQLGEDGADPVMQIKGMGDLLLTTGGAALGVSAIAHAGIFGAKAAVTDEAGSIVAKVAGVATGGVANAGVVGVAQGLLEFLDKIIEKASGLVLWIVYVGYFFSIWIPFIPFLVFALGVVGWLVSVIEAVAASSLWMVMHISPEGGDSFVGSQKQGYLLLMSVFFRPVLMVLGLMASMALTIPVMEFINAGVVIKIKALQVNSVTGLGSIVGYLLIYAFLVYSALMIIYSLPQVLPDRILRWIGGHIGDMGEQASMSKIEGGASAAAKTGALKSLSNDLRGKNNDKAGDARLTNKGSVGGSDEVM